MTNKKIGLGILALALVWGMTLAGCDNGSTTSNDVIDAKYQGRWRQIEGGAIGAVITINGNSVSVPEGSFSIDSYYDTNENDWDGYNVSAEGKSTILAFRLTPSGELEVGDFGEYSGTYTKVN